MARAIMILLSQKLIEAYRIYREQNKIAMNIIPLEKQGVSLELAKRLKELGVKQESF